MLKEYDKALDMFRAANDHNPNSKSLEACLGICNDFKQQFGTAKSVSFKKINKFLDKFFQHPPEDRFTRYQWTDVIEDPSVAMQQYVLHQLGYAGSFYNDRFVQKAGLLSFT